jgi:hypothetical protein
MLVYQRVILSWKVGTEHPTIGNETHRIPAPFFSGPATSAQRSWWRNTHGRDGALFVKEGRACRFLQFRSFFWPPGLILAGAERAPSNIISH